MTKVIILGNNLYNTLGLIRSVGEKGYPVILLLESFKKSMCYVNHSKYIMGIHYLTSIDQGLEVLLTVYGNESEKPIVLCGSDPAASLLDRHYDELKNKFYLFNAGEQGRINWFLDKINTFPIAAESGLSIIKTWQVENIHRLPSDIIFPCLIKGSNSTNSTKGDMYICQDRNELELSLHEGVKYLIQEYIQKEYELDIVGLSYNHGKNVYVPAVVRKIRDEIHRQSVYIRLDDIKEYPEFDVSIISKFLKKIGYEGIFSIEVIYSKGHYYFLEINMRNDGCGWLYTAAGINYPYLWTLYSTGKLNQYMLDNIKFKNHLYLMHEDDIYNMLERIVGFGQWLKDFHRAEAFFIMNRKDPLPFLMSLWVHFKQAIKMFLRKVFKCKIQ
jgi:predicted ATP-grasp superfamily ATP-dependent carboligase